MEKNRNKLVTSAVYIFDSALKEVGCDRNAYHKQSIDGNKGRNLMERREKFGRILVEKMSHCLQKSIDDRKELLKTDPNLVQRQLATQEELKDEVVYLVNTLSLLNCVLPPIRKVRSSVMTNSEIQVIKENIAKLKQHWNVKRNWESKKISITPMWHLLFYHIVPSLLKFGRLGHFAEDPIERMHAYDKFLSSQFSNIREVVKHENCKRKVLQINRHPEVSKTITCGQSKRVRIFNDLTIKAREQKQ